jgi:hypothetical protein
MAPIEATRIEGKGCTAILYYEEDSSYADPREWENLCEMRCSHRNYSLGDGEPEGRHVEALERGGLRLLERYLRLCENSIAFTSLGLLDHSGITIYAGGGSHWSDTAGWDSGTVGYAFVTRKRCDELGVTPGDAERQMLSEIEVYDSYLRGEVLYVRVIDDRGEEFDDFACGGFVGDACAEEYARDALPTAEAQVAEARRWERIYLLDPTVA